MKRPNIKLPQAFGKKDLYRRPGGGGTSDSYIPRDRKVHAEKLMNDLSAAINEAELQKQSCGSTSEGLYLEFDSALNEGFAVNSLEDERQGVRLLNVHARDGITKAAVFIPDNKKDFYQKKIERYSDQNKDTKKGEPSGKRLINNLEAIRVGDAHSLWSGDASELPLGNSRIWIEVWLSNSNHPAADIVREFFGLLDNLGINHKEGALKFPERCVALIQANITDLNKLIACCDSLSELRPATTATSFFTDQMGGEQRDWVDDLLARAEFQKGPSVVCILDSGVNSKHPLLSPACDEKAVLSYDPDWGTADNMRHGTSVAGLAIYGDLKSALESNKSVSVSHRFESVKIIEKGKENEPDLYGDVVMQAVSRIEVLFPERNRIICSAVTGDLSEVTDGHPTAWSAAVDELISRPGEENAELFLVSAGNVDENAQRDAGYPAANQIHSVRSPGQAWNAITVGGYIEDDLPAPELVESGFSPVAPRGSLSPYSSTSLSWGKRTPVKPEILCPSGCMITNGSEYYSDPSLSVLSTSADFSKRPFEPFYATSAAVAYAAWMVSEIENAYPSFWPETIRALVIHSAEWTQQMKSYYCGKRPEDNKTDGRRKLLRTCGYGVPNLDRAIECASNRVNLIIEDELHPYLQEMGADNPKLNEMRYYRLPWPKEMLQGLDASTKARLKVTLSYYIEPSPSGIGWNDKYRYPSFGLRFDVNRGDENLGAFLKRINAYARGEDEHHSTSGSAQWYIGASNRDGGSIHSDFIETYATELSAIEYIAVYPIGGWWYTRKHLNKANSKARFSLVVSIETPSADVELYTAVLNQIELETKVPVAVSRDTHISTPQG